MVFEQLSQLSLENQEERLEISPITPKLNRLGGRSATESPLSSRHPTENTPDSPRRHRRRKEPTSFNILVIGFCGSGKTSFVEYLSEQLNTLKDQQHSAMKEEEKPDYLDMGFTCYYAEAEINGERIGVTLWDSRGFGTSRDYEIVNLQMDEIILFMESKFENTFSEETKVIRSHKHIDTHIHCVLYLIDSTSSYLYNDVSLDSLDISIIQKLSRYTTVIPVISKVDTCTKRRIGDIKLAWRKEFEKSEIKILEFLGNNESHDDVSTSESTHSREKDENYDDIYNLLPFGCMTPDRAQIIPFSAEKAMKFDISREYSWGKANPLDEKHCDFSKLKEMVLGEWRNEIRDFSKEVLYENWRTDRLEKLRNLSSKDNKS
ncbi:hypothetical protein PNEG_00901 [Pneumocystis murina B123]|uniref:Septin-type G domain-containing protein n=1 Tax=Pneumocystis murina (strain B123) TaxID=1069680 RepID=M7NU17_PNEMU|nr:hypothetical protein PNEG_00901 [Pneumocystis murina B123]EMR10752.1 hypothetical protein PNEG_00901 [Pneumocystis murina B123]